MDWQFSQMRNFPPRVDSVLLLVRGVPGHLTLQALHAQLTTLLPRAPPPHPHRAGPALQPVGNLGAAVWQLDVKPGGCVS